MRVVFLDRDGVINENRNDHVKSWDEFQFVPGALEALRILRASGYYVFVVTNQAIIDRGLASVQTLNTIHEHMFASVSAYGGKIHDLRYCPHDSHVACECRKPRPGMLLELARRWHVDLSHAYLVGDAWTDMAAARTAGVRPILVQTGRGAEQLGLPELKQFPPIHIAAHLLEAVSIILEHDGITSHLDEAHTLRWPCPKTASAILHE